jgi:hypothetical protein
MSVSTWQRVLLPRSRAVRVSIARTGPMSRPIRLDACRESHSLPSAQGSAAHHERSVKIGCRPMISIRLFIRSCACSTIPMPRTPLACALFLRELLPLHSSGPAQNASYPKISHPAWTKKRGAGHLDPSVAIGNVFVEEGGSLANCGVRAM